TYKMFQVMSNELSTPKIVVCPSDDDRIIATNFGGHFDSAAVRNKGISYYYGIDAQETFPQMFLAGDHNLGDGNPATTIYTAKVITLGTNNNTVGYSERVHQKAGNTALSDGSVQQLTTIAFRNQLRTSGDAQNRLQFP